VCLNIELTYLNFPDAEVIDDKRGLDDNPSGETEDPVIDEVDGLDDEGLSISDDPTIPINSASKKHRKTKKHIVVMQSL
jgi:hypothetical protein